MFQFVLTMPIRKSSDSRPQISQVTPPAAIAGGELQIRGKGFARAEHPRVTIGEMGAPLIVGSDALVIARVPEGATAGQLVVQSGQQSSDSWACDIGVQVADSLHPVANPAVDAEGTVFATFSGTRGQSVPVSIFSIARDFEMRPFVRGILNATGLAFDADGYLYASSRAEGTVYRISPAGAGTTYAEGMGIATGIAFDRDGNLFVGDRSGTIFKVGPEQGRAGASGAQPGAEQTAGELGDRGIFVYATLEPSVAAYHLAFNDEGTLFVTGPTTSSNQSIYAIDRDGRTTVFYQGLGRAQGMAFDVAGNLYVAASLAGQRGIVRITPRREASLAVSGNNLVGLAFLDDGCAALATRDALYHVALDIEGRKLV